MPILQADTSHLAEFVTCPHRHIRTALQFRRIDLVHEQRQQKEQRIPTGAMPMNHSVQVMSTFAVVFTSDNAKRLGARPVRNIALVRQVVANAVHMMYDPIFRAVGLWAPSHRAAECS